MILFIGGPVDWEGGPVDWQSWKTLALGGPVIVNQGKERSPIKFGSDFLVDWIIEVLRRVRCS